MKRLRNGFMGIFILVASLFAFATEADTIEVTKIGQWGNGSYNDVVVVGDYAYAAAGTTGIDIINISNPAAPYLVSNYNTSGYARDVAVFGNYAYVTNSEEGLQIQIIDISNPAAPYKVGDYDTSGNASGVAVFGNYTYVANRYELQIVDLSNPAEPYLVGNSSLFNSLEPYYFDITTHSYIAVSGNYAYVIDNYSYYCCHAYGKGGYGSNDITLYNYYLSSCILQVVDISNPAEPYQVGNYVDLCANDVTVFGNYVYVVFGSRGLEITDISNPAKPIRVGGYYISGQVWGVAVSGNYAYVTDNEGLQIIDISNPTSSYRVGGYDTSGSAKDVAVSGDYIYVADKDNGLLILSMSEPVLQFSATTYNINEAAGTVTLTVHRLGESDGELTFNYATTDGTATEGSDYIGATGTLTWADGENHDQTITITILNDTKTEYNETFTVTLSDPISGDSLDSTTVTIQDDDPDLVKLDFFKAIALEKGGIRLEWQTATEVNSLGFHLWRATGEGWKNRDYSTLTRLTKQLIPAKGNSRAGASYSYTDYNVEPGVTYYYGLEDRSRAGKPTYYLDHIDSATAK